MSQIVLDCTPALYTTNGVGRVTEALLQSMLKHNLGNEFLLYSRSFKKKFKEYKGCKNLRMRIPKQLEGLINKWKIIEKLAPKADLFHATNHYMPLKDADRAIVTVHDLIFLKQPENHLKGIHAEMAAKAPEFIKKARHIITCSEYTKNDLCNILNIQESKITVIPWGLNQELFRIPENKNQTRNSLNEKFGIQKPFFLGVSCSIGRKNTPMLLNAYKKLLKSNPENDLVLVWDAPQDIREKYKHPRIHFTGKVNDESLRDLYGCATATIYPSLYEGFGLPVLESMSCGTPVICSDVTSLPEVGKDAAIYINPLDQQTLVNAMENFENNLSGLEELETKGRKLAAEFTWEKCALETQKVYGSL